MKTNSSFLQLPGEIRNEIYYHAFLTHDHIDAFINKVNDNPRVKGLPEGYLKGNNLALLLTCRQIYMEAHLIAFHNTTFITRAWGEPSVGERVSQALESLQIRRDKLALITSLTLPVPGSIVFRRWLPATRVFEGPRYDMFDLLCSGVAKVIRIARFPELRSVRTFTIIYLAPHSRVAGGDSEVEWPNTDMWSGDKIAKSAKRKEANLLRRMGNVTPCVERKQRLQNMLNSGRSHLDLALSWTQEGCEELSTSVDFTFVCVKKPKISYVPEVAQPFSCETLDIRRR
ncbi:hypothetical protein BDV96DRAFT_201365 [Lophiotrema nucula]|uniref:Uncharacterized protein n=1 Tax=Lophiotrema nucula TaxID=690887 RepID=A0A6A5YTM6_9PLEO|nr:hypothetical protein BDV96DRAFT_201365 [Lophiotrema nucula]